MFHRNVIVQVAVAIFCLVASVRTTDRRPNIIVVLADDLGWNDVSFHGSNQFHTPNIDALAYNGIILNSHYVPALCTPSRASFLTGKYPTSMGMQHLVILSAEPWGLPLQETIMPQHFKRHGYATHAIGKWHLGFHQKEYTPLFRGFDSHFGYWNGFQDYYDHTMHAGPLKGYDMRRGMDVDYSCEGLYSTDVFTNEAVSIIENHNSTQGPLFLYLSHLAAHSGNPENPFQAPEDEISKHLHIEDPERRVYAAMVTKLDESVGKIMSALEKAEMLEDSIVLFMADNGGPTIGIHSNRASNYPLRGMKESPWEGGIRGAAAIWSPLIRKTGRVSNQLMHMSDWLPTLYAAAGLNTTDLGEIDGINMWETLSSDRDSPRKEVFHNYDEIEGYSSLQVGSWKFVEGSAQDGAYDEWYGETGREENLKYDPTLILESETNAVLKEFLTKKQNETDFPGSALTEKTILELRRNSLVNCEYPTFRKYSLITGNHTRQHRDGGEDYLKSGEFEYLNDEKKGMEAKIEIIGELENIYRKYPPLNENGKNFHFSFEERKRLEKLVESGKLRNLFKCDPMKEVCLFNLKSDQCERVNLAKIFPNVVDKMKIRLSELKGGVVKPLNVGGDPFSDPAYHNGTWVNWRDVQGIRFSYLIARMTEFVRSASRFDRFFTASLEKLFLKEFFRSQSMVVDDSSPSSSILNLQTLSKWYTWFLGLGLIVLVTGAARRINAFPKYSQKNRS